MLSDSVVEYDSSGLHSSLYRYQSVNNIVTSSITVNGQSFIVGKYLVAKDNNGNTVSEKDSGFVYNSGVYSYSGNSDKLSTYDTKYCSFYKLYPKRLVELDYELVAVNDVPFYGFYKKAIHKLR